MEELEASREETEELQDFETMGEYPQELAPDETVLQVVEERTEALELALEALTEPEASKAVVGMKEVQEEPSSLVEEASSVAEEVPAELYRKDSSRMSQVPADTAEQ